MAITPFKVIQGHRFWYQSKAHMRLLITGSAVALHCCKAHSNINRKMDNLTHCKTVTPENFILKPGTRDYVDEVTYYTIFDVDHLNGFFPQIGENITLCDFFPVLSCPFFSF